MVRPPWTEDPLLLPGVRPVPATLRIPRLTIGGLMALIAVIAVELGCLGVPLAIGPIIATLAAAWFGGKHRALWVSGFLFVGLLVGAAFLPGPATWVGRRKVPIACTVVDAVTKRPIPTAVLEIAYPRWSAAAKA